MELKTALSNFQKDRYVSSMMREELETVLQAVKELQAQRAPEVPLASIEAKLGEALALLKGVAAPANSKSRPKGRKADAGSARPAASVAAKAKS